MRIATARSALTATVNVLAVAAKMCLLAALAAGRRRRGHRAAYADVTGET